MTTRITFDISDEVHEQLCNNIPHGLRKYAYRALIEGLAKKLEEGNSPEILSAVLTYHSKYHQYIAAATDNLLESE